MAICLFGCIGTLDALERVGGLAGFGGLGATLMGELNRGERLQIMLTQNELRVVDTWRFKKRMPSRASAVRELLKRGLAAEGFLEADEGQRSKDFSVE
jgi:hypothetical protein